MGIISDKFNEISEYLISITRDTVNGWYIVQIGLLPDWEFDTNDLIDCKIVNENEYGKVIDIFPKKDDVDIDDLFKYINIIIETNISIENKKKEIELMLQEYKTKMENEARKHFDDLENMKKSSFKDIGKMKDENLTDVDKKQTSDVDGNSSDQKKNRSKDKKNETN